MIAHVLHEASSPPEVLVWHMWCGAECFVFDDGSLAPELDFYLEQDAAKSDCVECLKARLACPRVDAHERTPA